MYSQKDLIGAVIVLVTAFAIFRLSSVREVTDSNYEMLFSQQLLWNHSFSVDARVLPQLKSHKPGQIHQRGVDLPYQLVQMGERFYYLYPPANTILAMPYVALANARGISAMDKNGSYDPRGDKRIQAGLAAVLMAALSVIIFLTSRLILPYRWSLLITVATALGTQVWSTASRVMWSHTWGIFILSFVIWLMVRTEAKQMRLPPVLLATCVSWLYFVRPTFGLSIAAVALYVLIYHRSNFVPFVLTGCIWLAALIGFSQYHYSELLPPYYHSYMSYTAVPENSFWQGLAGTLVSPSRGLFVYIPVLAFLAYLLGRYRNTWRPGLVGLAIGVVVAHVALLSSFIGWHGGYCYGPRLSTDVVPWFALLGMLAVQARLQWHAANPARDSPLRIRTESALAGVLLICSITLHGIGALWVGASKWNVLPVPANEDSGRLWDWRHPPFFGVPRDSVTHDQKSTR